MQQEGPILESLTRRLTETPEEFLAEPRIGKNGTVEVPAVVGDLLRLLNAAPSPAELARFTSNDARQDRNRLSISLLLSWLLADDWFRQAKLSTTAVLDLIDKEAGELSQQSTARKFITDPDRREELARLTLARLGYRPAGETLPQAQDRLTTLSSAERARVMKASRAAEERARQIREALVKKAAEESADKFSRE
jgi:hypothetical protein